MKKIVLFSTLSLAIFSFNRCAKNPVTGKSQVVLMSESQELAMGQEADPQVIAQYGLYPDSAIQRYMRQQGQRMAAISHRPNISYGFRVINSDVLNAFAIPGFVYFTRGIMAYFNNEAQFNGVLGHEIGHIAARHTVSQQRNSMLGQLGIIAGIIINPNLAQFADVASQGVGLMLLKNSRDAEREADKLGVEYSSKIGYDAQQMANFFKTLEREQQESGNQALPTFLSTHPDPGARFETVSQLANEWKQNLHLTNPQVNRNTYLQLIEGLIFGQDPREGYVEAGVFYHPELRFQFPVPADWSFQNTPQQVQMASKDGKAMMLLMLAQGSDLQGAASAAMQQYKLQVVESRRVTVNGLPAMAVVADQQQQNGGVLRTLSYFIQYGQSIYHMIGVAAAADFTAYVNLFTNTMQSFRQLTDQAKINKKPERIHIRTVGQTGTLDQALRALGMSSTRFQQLALLNGMQLTDTVQQGTLIKVIGE